MQFGLGVGTLNSTLRFDSSDEVEIELKSVSSAGSWRLTEDLSVRAGLGVVYDGTLKLENETTYVVRPGGLFSIGFDYLHFRGEGYYPSLDFSVFLSASSTKIEHPITEQKTDYFSSDLRLGGRATWNISNKLFPYAAGRLFGGPVSWELEGEDVSGSDIHHYQFALGTAIQIGSVGTFAEWAGLGEKAMSIGLSYAW